MSRKTNWRLGLDMGTNSMGWVALSLDDNGDVTDLMDTGVRIFSDGRQPAKNGLVGESLAVERRTARGMRRNRDRRIKRKNQLLDRLIELGLMPEDSVERKALAKSDPYRLRAEAVERTLSPHELGRALFHLNQRRGFKSNRKTDNADEESGKIKPKISALRDELNERQQTLGQWLYDRTQQKKSTRFRGEEGNFYPDRAMYLEEFEAIKAKQKPHHHLSEDDWKDLQDGNKDQKFDGIFFQRPLKPVERGKCQFFIKEDRAHKDLPIAHEFRILQEVANLSYDTHNGEKRDLTPVQRTLIIETLQKQKTLSFGSICKKELFAEAARFNLQEGPRDVLNGNNTACEMRNPKMLGTTWDELSPDQQNDLVEYLHLHEENDEGQLIEKLTSKFPLTEEQAKDVSSKFKLSAATTNLSRKFMTRCAKVMREKEIGYAEATSYVYDDNGVLCQQSDNEKVDRLLEKLPYYGELLTGSLMGGNSEKLDSVEYRFDPVEFPEQHFGKINNPTVHVALNQLAKLVNCLIERFGRPTEIHVELSRDLKKSKKDRDEITKKNKKNASENKRREEDWQKLFKQKPSGLDIKKIKLWEELGLDGFSRPCPFSGENISAQMLFNGEVEIEHILPFSRTLDNSMANLTLATKQANQLKGNRTPFEAFQSGYPNKDRPWGDILKEAKDRFPRNKRWRFEEDAMERFGDKNKFIARQLTDNAYISRVTKRYLKHICDENKIVTIPGGLTAMMRGKWDLNSLLGDHNYKERNDHRHHAVDAFVVGLTSRSMLQKVSRQTHRGVDGEIHIKLPDITELRDAFRERLKDITISYKPDHGVNGKMFEETAYGLVPEDKRDEDLKGYDLVTRKEIDSLTRKQTEAIRNHGWRKLVQQHLEKKEAAGQKLDKNGLKKALAEFGKTHKIKTIRILVKGQAATPIGSPPFKAYTPDSYICVDIWQLPKGKPGKWQRGKFDWKGVFWQPHQCIYDHNRNLKLPDKKTGKIGGADIHPAAKFITRLFKNDLIQLRDGADTKIMRVAGFSTTDNKIDLRPQYETEADQKYISINVVQHSFIKKLNILPDGRHRDGSPRG